MLMKHTKQEEYLAPEFEIMAVEVEQGFSLSNLENPEERPEQGW